MSDFDIKELVGNLVKIDLTDRKICTEKIDESVYRKFLGGRGLDQLLLFRELDKNTSPLCPKNVILFGSGLFVGTGFPGSVRLSIDTKNYFSSGVGSANVGGDFSRELKLAGISTLLVSGKADEPVYISIDDGDIDINAADDIWGRTVSESTDMIKNRESSGSVLCIGKAGENLVRGASVMVDRARAAAKCGIGSVMGSKNLKGIIASGSKEMKVSDEQKFDKIIDETWDKVNRSTSTGFLNKHGTLSVKSKNEIGGVPLHHYQDGFMKEEDLKKIDKHSFKGYESRRFSVKDCPIDCRAEYKIESGKYEGTKGEAMEANTIQNFGFKLGITEPEPIIKAHILCNEYGMDMDTVAESLAWAFECYEKGIIDGSDYNGLELEWGDHEAMIELIHDIADREGLGDLLAEGVDRASEELGSESQRLAVSMKGQDLYETIRMPKGYGLGAALSTRGGGHCSGSPLTEFSNGGMGKKEAKETYGVETADIPHVYEGKAELVADHERFHAVLNSVGMCFFSTTVNSGDLLGWGDISKMISALTGWEMDEEELMGVGERIHNLERYINYVHAGFDRKNDYPPDRFFEESISSGPYSGERLDKEKFDEMLSENYEKHGWSKDGIPRRKRLIELELDRFIDLEE